jgi:dTDP-glucose 4,6-dehydratase
MFDMQETFFVIGSNSFSGASFTAAALDEGARTIATSRSSEPASAFLPYRWNGPRADLQFHQLDLNKDLHRIVDLIAETKPQYVVNFAAQSMVAESWRNPEHWFQTNVVATVQLHEQLRRFDFIKKYVHISTPEVYGSCSGFIGEDTAFNPSTPYAVSRAAADMSLRTFQTAYQFPVVWTRAANVYGPGQQLYRIIPRTVLFIRLGRKIQLHGGGVSSRSFIHIRDVSDATLRIARHGAVGQAYHISTERTLTIRELVEMTCKRMGVEFDKHVEVVGERLGKDAAYLLDSTKLKSTLGWQDRISLEEGLDEVIKWVDDNLDVLSQQEMDYIHKP